DDQRRALPVAARIAIPQTHALWQVRTAVEWNDPRLVTHFEVDNHVAWRLHNLVVGQIALAVTSAQTRYRPRDAPDGGAEILGTSRPLSGSPSRGATSTRVVCQRRDVAIGGIRDERRAVVEVALDHLLGTMRRGDALELGAVLEGREKDGIS